MRAAFFLFPFLSFCVPLAWSLDAEKSPNIVLIIADDMAWDDCSPYGHPKIKTPQLQRLADGGMRFDRAFLTTSSCSPTRASLITGRYPQQTGADELSWPIPADQVTFVEMLDSAGYWTGAAGKWHMGEEIRDRFDVIFDAKSRKNERAMKDGKSGCLAWIPLMEEIPAGTPFFLWLAALDPHRGYFEGALPEGEGHVASDIVVPPYHPDTAAVRDDYRLYYDEIGRLDRYVGKVLDQLEVMGVADNTMVVFISDNGRPFPRDKTTLYDSGIKTPWIVSWPNKVKAGTACESLVSVIDIAPTLVEAAGIEEKPETFEGQSILTLLENPQGAIREQVFAEKNWHDYEDCSRAVRDLRYKYIRNRYFDLPLTPAADVFRGATFQEMLKLKNEGGLSSEHLACFTQPRPQEELYDTEADPNELVNLAEHPDFADIKAGLSKKLDEWEVRVGDTVPAFRTPDEWDRRTGTPLPTRPRPRPSKAEMIEAGTTAP